MSQQSARSQATRSDDEETGLGAGGDTIGPWVEHQAGGLPTEAKLRAVERRPGCGQTDALGARRTVRSSGARGLGAGIGGEPGVHTLLPFRSASGRLGRAAARLRSAAGALGAGAVLSAALGCVTPGLGPVIAWCVGDARELRPVSQPLLESELYSAARGVVKLSAAINETVAIQLAVRSDAPPAGAFDVHVSDLVSPAGRLEAAESVRVYRVRPVRVTKFASWYPRHTGRSATPLEAGDVLTPWDAPRGGGPLRIDDRRTHVIWIDLWVPPTAGPGAYAGTLELRRRGDPPQAVFRARIELEVLPVKLPGERALPVLCRIDPRDLLAEHFDWPEGPPEELRILPDEAAHAGPRRLVESVVRELREHRMTPALWACFPKFRLADERTVEVDWQDYDALHAPWFDGDAFSDQMPLERLVLPVSENHPSAERNGGFDSPAYARVLAAYVRACQEHFAQRGWAERSVLRMFPPQRPDAEVVRRLERVAGILRHSATAFPLVAHLPAGTLRGLGWVDAPAAEPGGVGIWAGPARWSEPSRLSRERGLGRVTWFMPDRPPYSGSLAVYAPATDACSLGWQAYRYGLDGVWIEHAADARIGAGEASAADPLVYAGRPFGLIDQVVPSVRLKRLRRGQQDYELLKLLEKAGKPLLAQRTAQQVVRWAFTDACAENLLRTRECGWSQDAVVYELARRVVLQELANAFAPSQAGRERQIANLADWGRLMSAAPLAQAEALGTRLALEPAGLVGRVFVAVSNDTDVPHAGTWRLAELPVGWTLRREVPVTVAPRGRSAGVLELDIRSLAYNGDGVYRFEVRYESATVGTIQAAARLAVAACPFVDPPPEIDGELGDWIAGLNNSAGDFLLCRGDGPPGAPRRPTAATRAYFCADAQTLYVAVQCQLPDGEQPSWRPDNVIPIDADCPWGQDVVEVLLCPQDATVARAEDIFVLQIKPSGFVATLRGPRTEPPMNRSEPWAAQARVAVGRRPDAWTVEAALPLRSLNTAARGSVVWGCNITRLDSQRGEYSSWSGARGYTYAPELMGNLILQAP